MSIKESIYRESITLYNIMGIIQSSQESIDEDSDQYMQLMFDYKTDYCIKGKFFFLII